MNIPPDIRAVLDDYYQEQRGTRFGAAEPSLEQELAFIDDLLAASENVVPLPGGNEAVISGGDQWAAEDGAPALATAGSTSAQPKSERSFGKLALFMLAVVAVVFLMYGKDIITKLRGRGNAEAASDESTAQASTPNSGGVQLPAAIDSIVASSEMRVPLVVPRTLELTLAAQQVMTDPMPATFPIIPVEVEEADWPCQPPDDAPAACWVYGTVVNYLVALPAAHQGVMEAMQPGDTIHLRLSSERVLPFDVEWVRVVPRQEVEVLRQNRFGLTLVLAQAAVDDGADSRLVAWAPYRTTVDAEGDVASSPSRQTDATVSLGATVDFNSLRLTPISTWQAGDQAFLMLNVVPQQSVQTEDWQVSAVLDTGEEVVATVPTLLIETTQSVQLSASVADARPAAWRLTVTTPGGPKTVNVVVSY
jgi:hypothetical protein